MTRLLLALVAGLIISTSAYAADKGGGSGKVRAAEQDVLATPEPLAQPMLAGFYVSAGAGLAKGSTEADFGASGFGSILNIDGLSSQGAIYRLTAGYDFKVQGSPFMIRSFISHSFGKAEFDVVAGGTNIVNASLEPNLSTGGGLAYVFANGVYAFGGAQWGRADLNINVLGTSAVSKSVDGWGPYAGLGFRVSKSLDLEVKWDRLKYDVGNVLPASAAPLYLNLDTNVDTVMVSAVFKLGPSN